MAVDPSKLAKSKNLTTNLKKLTELYATPQQGGVAKLCKFEQVSNWETRPLRQSQLHYAALDAQILIQIFQAMQTEIAKAGYDIYGNIEVLEKKRELADSAMKEIEAAKQ